MEKGPILDVQVVLVEHLDGNATLRLRARRFGDEYVTLHSWQYGSGRPTAAQLQESLATIADVVSNLLVTRVGVQGVLFGAT